MADAQVANTFLGTPEPVPEASGPGYANLRIWPAVVLLAILWVACMLPYFVEGLGILGLILAGWSPLLCGVGVAIWWLAASRARASERRQSLVGLIVIGAVATLLAHPSIRGIFALLLYVLPWVVTAFAGALIVLHRWQSPWRVPAALLITAMAFGYWDALRFEGMWGDFSTTLAWRWEPTAEDKYLAGRKPQGAPSGNVEAPKEPLGTVFWPGFRGPARDGVVPDVVLAADWKAHPPQKAWARSVGPAWSSFAVAGDRLFTQEQRGEKEAVVCWEANSGEEIWALEFEGRFDEALGGAGPRATPTLGGGRLFALSALGFLQCLDPLTGKIHWTRDLRINGKREQPPAWGFSSSPLVAGNVVIVHAGGPEDRGVLAYDVRAGALQWSIPSGDHSYSSPQLARMGGRNVVLMLTNTEISAVDPASARVVWEYPWATQGYRVVQPLFLKPNSVLLGTGMGTGTRRIDVTEKQGLAAEFAEPWTSTFMSPDFNDFVAHKGYLYGFDQAIFACIDLASGQRKWKKGRYGKGQVLLLPDADQLLVLSETGDAVLLKASPEGHEELARHPMIEGKTWNHPVLLADGRFFVRNGEQAACFKLHLSD